MNCTFPHCRFVHRQVVILATALITMGAHAQAPPSSVRVDEVRAESVQQRRMVTGNVRAVTRSMVATVEPGLVLDLPVQEGQRVARDEKLAVLDARRLEIQLQQLEARLNVQDALLAERTAQVQLRRSDLDLIESLAERGAVNPKELSDARAELAVAEARREQVIADLNVTRSEGELLRQRVADMTIVAPFDGIVISRHTERGQWVAEGDALIELVSDRMYDVWLDVPQRLAKAIDPDDLTVQVHVEAVGRTFASTAIRMVGDIDATARTFALVVRVDDSTNPEDETDDDLPRLAPGMSATAMVPTGNLEQRLTVPKDAVLRNDAGPFVYVVRGGGEGQPAQVAPVQIEILFELPTRLVVANGSVQAGDRVVVEGNERLMPMAPVQVVQPPDRSAAPELHSGAGESTS